ncbi:MAG: (d)CMP kinase [Acidimicrobiales bacterium]
MDARGALAGSTAKVAAPLIAIDGPAGSGKSTVSRAVAQRLGLDRLDTGAMYRCVAWAVMEEGVDPKDTVGVAKVARSSRIEVGHRVCMNGTDVTRAIRTPEVSAVVSVVAANPDVRRRLVVLQRAWADAREGGVVEGRDTGSVVFPHADLKVFLTATLSERSRRRGTEEPADILALRDRLDSTRAISPLRQAAGAHLLDTTGRDVDAVVDEILSWL